MTSGITTIRVKPQSHAITIQETRQIQLAFSSCCCPNPAQRKLIAVDKHTIIDIKISSCWDYFFCCRDKQEHRKQKKAVQLFKNYLTNTFGPIIAAAAPLSCGIVLEELLHDGAFLKRDDAETILARAKTFSALEKPLEEAKKQLLGYSREAFSDRKENSDSAPFPNLKQFPWEVVYFLFKEIHRLVPGANWHQLYAQYLTQRCGILGSKMAMATVFKKGYSPDFCTFDEAQELEEAWQLHSSQKMDTKLRGAAKHIRYFILMKSAKKDEAPDVNASEQARRLATMCVSENGIRVPFSMPKLKASLENLWAVCDLTGDLASVQNRVGTRICLNKFFTVTKEEMRSYIVSALTEAGITISEPKFLKRLDASTITHFHEKDIEAMDPKELLHLAQCLIPHSRSYSTIKTLT